MIPLLRQAYNGDPVGALRTLISRRAWAFGLVLPHSTPSQTTGASATPAPTPHERRPILTRLAKLAAAALVAALLLMALSTDANASTIAQARREVWRLWGPQAPRMLCTIDRESSWRPWVVSPTNDHGLAQLNAPTWRRHFGRRWALVYDPVENVRMAREVFLITEREQRRRGWTVDGFRAWMGRC